MWTTLATGAVKNRVQMNAIMLQELQTRFAKYLSSLIQQYTPSRCLHSSTEDQLNISRSNSKTSSRRFSLATPRIWNGLPVTVRAVSSSGSIQNQLKMHFYPLSTSDQTYLRFCCFELKCVINININSNTVCGCVSNQRWKLVKLLG